MLHGKPARASHSVRDLFLIEMTFSRAAIPPFRLLDPVWITVFHILSGDGVSFENLPQPFNWPRRAVIFRLAFGPNQVCFGTFSGFSFCAQLVSTTPKFFPSDFHQSS